MEIKTNPFYELRNRLYASAAAGCSVIAEDFRLQKALEAFKPVSEKNKVFGRLYAMCSKLMNSENPARDIADCIALADALAVTQGTFADNSETVPVKSAERLKPQDIEYSRLNEYITQIKNTRYGRQLFPEEFSRLVLDPRIFAAYIEVSDVNGYGVDELSQIFEKAYGDSLIQPLIDALDLSDPKKASGTQLKYICRIAGAEYNDLYISLAENADNPPNVRIHAIEALACSEDNAELLLTLYQTEKAKIKNAAILSLAKLSSPLAEEPLKKYLSKFKQANVDVVEASKRKICSDYARDSIEYCLANEDKVPDSKHHSLLDSIRMLANKTDVSDCFEKLAEFVEKSDTRTSKLFSATSYMELGYTEMGAANNILTENIYFNDGSEYREMILNLYEKYPDFFFPARLYMELKGNPENAFYLLADEAEKHVRYALNIINNIYLVQGGKYMLPCSVSGGSGNSNSTEIFASIPANMLDFLSDTSNFFNAMSQNAIKDAHDKCISLVNLMNRCSINDAQRVRKAAEKLALALCEYCPSATAINLIAKSDHQLSEGVIVHYITDTLEKRNSENISGNPFIHYYYLRRFEVPEEYLASELKMALEKIPELKIPKSHIERQLREIRSVLASLPENVKT